MARKGEKKPLSPKQLKAIEMLMDIDNPLTNKEIAARLEIHESTLYDWKKDPEFLKALNEYAEEWIRASKYRVNKQLLKKIDQGDTSAIRLYYEKIQELQQMGTLKLVVNLGGLDDGSAED